MELEEELMKIFTRLDEIDVSNMEAGNTEYSEAFSISLDIFTDCGLTEDQIGRRFDNGDGLLEIFKDLPIPLTEVWGRIIKSRDIIPRMKAIGITSILFDAIQDKGYGYYPISYRGAVLGILGMITILLLVRHIILN